MRFRPVDEDPMYIGMRNYRKEAEKRVEIDFSDAPIAKLYPLPLVQNTAAEKLEDAPAEILDRGRLPL